MEKITLTREIRDSIQTEKLSTAELEEHKKDLAEALAGKRVEYKGLCFQCSGSQPPRSPPRPSGG